MEDDEDSAFHLDRDSLANTDDPLRALSDCLLDRGIDRAENEGVCDSDLFNCLAENPVAQALDVDDDVGKFGHGGGLS
jgi:hypothetical protein